MLRRSKRAKPTRSSAAPASYELAWRVYESAKSWIVQVDVKATVALAIEAAVLGLVLALVSSSGTLAGLTTVARWGVATALVLLLASVILSIRVLMPRIKLRNHDTGKTTRAGYLYFGQLRHWDTEQLSAVLREEGIDGDDLARQIIVNSKIAWRKHVLLQWSLRLLTAGIVIVGALFLLLVTNVVPGLVDQSPSEISLTGAQDVVG